MRAWRPVAVSFLVIGFAYLADRALTAAILQHGTLPEAGNRAMVMTVDILGSLLTVTGVAVLGWLIVREPTARVAALVVIGIGAYFGLAVGMAVLMRGALELPFAFDAYSGGAHFTRWAGAAVGVLGVVALLLPASPARRPNGTTETGWLPVAVVGVLLALAFLVIDPALEAAFVDWSANLEAVPFVAVDVLVRLAIVTSLLGVAWLGANSRNFVVGVATLCVGLTATVGLAIATAAMSPALAVATLWISSSAVVLGAWQLLTHWTTRATEDGGVPGTYQSPPA
jgi:hypothetical protein